MEPAPATRPVTPAECRRQALLLGWPALFFLLIASKAPHWALMPRSLVALILLLFVWEYSRLAIHWLLISRYMGQTVTFCIGPSSHPLWNRTVTYDVPQAKDGAKGKPVQTPLAVAVTVVLTMLTGGMVFLTILAFALKVKYHIQIGVCLSIADISLILYTIHCWKRVWQDRERLRQAQVTPETP